MWRRQYSNLHASLYRTNRTIADTTAHAGYELAGKRSFLLKYDRKRQRSRARASPDFSLPLRFISDRHGRSFQQQRCQYMRVSVVIPCKNEAKNLAFLLDEILVAFMGRDFEIIVVNDGSTDETADVVKRMRDQSATVPIRLLNHDRSAGQSAAVRSGVHAANGEIVCTIDGDGQNDPAYLPKLADAIAAAGNGCGVAAGQRFKRTDTKLKQLSSRFANGLRQAVLKDNTRDSGCGLKAVRTDLFRSFPYFDGWHRYIPALAVREGYSVVHLDVVDRERRYGKSNYGILDRALYGLLDLIGVWWLLRRRRVVPAVTEDVS